MAEYRLGRVAGLELSARPSALAGTLIGWLVLSAVGYALIGLGPIEAVAVGLIGMSLHWATELWHHLGHAWAARSTGYPMTGVRFDFLLGSSLYPRKEPPLAAEIHIRRALGGPAASLVLAAVAAPFLVAGTANQGLPWWLALFLFLDNVLNVAQAFVPLGFNDGSTLLYWWRRR